MIVYIVYNYVDLFLARNTSLQVHSFDQFMYMQFQLLLSTGLYYGTTCAILPGLAQLHLFIMQRLLQ